MIPQDGLIRNLFHKDHIDADSKVVTRGAFKALNRDHGTGLSVTRSEPDVRDEQALNNYLLHVSRGLAADPDAPERLGCCYVTEAQLAMIDAKAIEVEQKRAKQPLPEPMPKLALVENKLSDELFDRSHCLIQDQAQGNLCPENSVQRLLAFHATSNTFGIAPIPKPAPAV